MPWDCDLASLLRRLDEAPAIVTAFAIACAAARKAAPPVALKDIERILKGASS